MHLRQLIRSRSFLVAFFGLAGFFTLIIVATSRIALNTERQAQGPAMPTFEYLWYEAENMRGISETSQHEPLLNPSYIDLPSANAPGWCISGPGVSAEWSQGGESEWNSVAASGDETRGAIWQDIEIPRGGEYRVWVRYADFGNKPENFVVRILQERRAAFRHEFGAKDFIDSHD